MLFQLLDDSVWYPCLALRLWYIEMSSHTRVFRRKDDDEMFILSHYCVFRCVTPDIHTLSAQCIHWFDSLQIHRETNIWDKQINRFDVLHKWKRSDINLINFGHTQQRLTLMTFNLPTHHFCSIILRWRKIFAPIKSRYWHWTSSLIEAECFVWRYYGNESRLRRFGVQATNYALNQSRSLSAWNRKKTDANI